MTIRVRQLRIGSLNGLDDLKAFKLGVTQVERLVAAGTAMRLAEGVRGGPGLEGRFVTPDRVGGIQDVIVPNRSTQQVEGHEARHAGQMRVAGGPDVFERRLGAEQNLEA